MKTSRFLWTACCFAALGFVSPVKAQSTVAQDGQLGGPGSALHSSGRFFSYLDWTMDPEYQYTIDLTSNDFDTLLTIQDGNRRIREDDDGGGGLNSRLVFVPPHYGSFRIGITSFAAGARGNYRIQVRADKRIGPMGPGNDTEVVVNETLRGPRFEQLFPVVNGSKYVVNVQSGTGRTITRADGSVGAPAGFFDTVLTLQYEDGTPIGGNDDIAWPTNSNSELTFTANRDGNIRILVGSYRTGETGPFRLSVRR